MEATLSHVREKTKLNASMSWLLGTAQRESSVFFKAICNNEPNWIHHSMLEMRRESTHWNTRGEAAPIIAKSVLFTKMVMVSVFWDVQEVSLIDYLEKSKTITGKYYATFLIRLRAAILEKHLEIMKKVFYYHQNSKVCLSRVAEKKFYT